MKLFKIESIITNLKECLAGTQFLENDYLKKLVNEYTNTLAEGTLTEVKQIWDRLDVALRKANDDVTSLYTKKTTKR